jgi:MoaA/NifB/PqqE/SkfB family radical SAM enzyme
MPAPKKIKLSDYGFSILQIETQPHCNMKCLFCAYPTRKQKGGALPDRDVFKAIDSLDPGDGKLEYICLSHYNEPLLDRRIFKFIKYAKNKGFRVLVITNGLLFSSREIQQRLVDAAPTYIKISFQTIDEESFRSRGIDYPFSKYKESIRAFLGRALDAGCPSKITIDVACNFMGREKKALRSAMGLECGDPSVPDSINDIKPGLLAFFRELKGDPRFDFDENKAVELLGKATPRYLDQTGITLARNIKLKVKQFIYGRRLADFHPVRAGRPCGTRIAGILSDGSVAPCCLAYDGRLRMGNIKKDSLGKILERNRGLIAAIRHGGAMPPVCRACQGAPTKHGALLLGAARYLQDRKR